MVNQKKLKHKFNIKKGYENINSEKKGMAIFKPLRRVHRMARRITQNCRFGLARSSSIYVSRSFGRFALGDGPRCY